MRKNPVLIGVMVMAFVGFGGTPAVAQSGYFPIEDLGLFSEGDLEVDVDLSGAMLRVAAGAMENQDESLAELVANLERVRLQVGASINVDAETASRKIADVCSTLEGSGWQKILSVEEGAEQVYLFAIESAGNIAGLTALVNEGGEEIVVVNIVGDIEPETLGRLLAKMEDLDLDELMSAVERQD